MTEYEMVHEIKNLCPNNQMRDVFFEEVCCDDPADFVRRRLKGRSQEITGEPGPGGAVTVYAVVDGLTHKFLFTPI